MKVYGHGVTGERGVFTVRRVAAVVLVVATVLFVWGALAERGTRVAGTTAVSTGSPSTVAKDGDGGVETTVPATVSTVPVAAAKDADGGLETGAAASSEHRKVLGVNLESGWLIALGVVVSLLVAGAVGTRTTRWPLVVMVVVAAVFVVVEIAEVAHQHTEHRAGLVTLAILAGFAHATVVVLAGHQLTDRSVRVA